jgi:hypothetical protein
MDGRFVWLAPWARLGRVAGRFPGKGIGLALGRWLECTEGRLAGLDGKVSWGREDGLEMLGRWTWGRDGREMPGLAADGGEDGRRMLGRMAGRDGGREMLGRAVGRETCG